MKKFFCMLTCFVAVLAFVAAIEVDEVELRVPGGDAIQFENYGGPHAVIETVEAIIGIGRALGQEVAADVETPATIHPAEKYTLVHAIDLESVGALDADILLLNETAGVDHIRNLRRIILGYLETAYGYSRDDAETIATFVTIYNAVYRNQLDNFTAKYKDIVLRYLTADKVGLSTNWQDWAGNTQIVIPLNDVNGGISTVDTTTITDDQVIDALKDEEDKGVEAREKMNDLKEREATNATEKAQAAQRDAVQQRNEGNKTAAAQSAQNAKTQQQLADRKNNELRTEKPDVAQDKLEVQTPVDTSNYLTGLFVVDDANSMYRLITVDGETGRLIRRSPVTQIRGRTVYGVFGVTIRQEDGSEVTYPELYLAVCGVNDGKSAVKLCLIDTEKMEIQKQSDETLAEGTAPIPFNDVFLVVIQQGSDYYVAAYDKNVRLQYKSALPVRPTSPFNITDRGILVTDTSGNPRLLDLRDLSTLWTTASGGATVDAK